MTSSERKFLASYKPSRFPRPAVTVDIVIFTLVDAVLKVLLVRRAEHPLKGRWALPGGFVRVTEDEKQGEDLDAAAARELEEETGLSPRGHRILLEQLRAFGAAGRDPRMRVISVAYYALVRPTLAPLVRGGGDVSHAEWHPIDQVRALDLAFDHADILESAVARIRAEIDRFAGELVPESFSIAELRAVYEAVAGRPLDPGNFRKRVLRMIDDGVLAQAPGKRVTASKPAKVYRFAKR